MKVYNIPVFVSHQGCPFDCAYCNQRHITGNSGEVTAENVRNIIESYLETICRKDSFIEAAFFGGSFTGIEPEKQRGLLAAAFDYIKKGSIDGIRISTRPDYISESALNLLAEYGVTTIELGVQSLDSDVLKASRRGHSAEDVVKAVECIRKYNFNLGLQMMTGLPEDTPDKCIATAEKISAMKPDFVRIYPTLIVKDTLLEVLYKKGLYKPQSLDEAVSLCAELKKIFDREKIKIIRISLVTTDEISPGGSLVAGPFHPSFGELVETELYYEKMSELLSDKTDRENIYIFFVNPKEVSKAVGNKRKNIGRIYNKMGFKIKVRGRGDIDRGNITL